MLKVCEKVPPVGSKEELNSLPESEVIVCWTESLLVQVTVVPTGTVRVLGEKEEFEIETEFPEPEVPGPCAY